MEVQPITWVQILQVGGLAGITTAILNALIKGVVDGRERKRTAKYLALRLSLIFENYYQACVDRISAIDNHKSSLGHIGLNYNSLPDIAEYPQDAALGLTLKAKLRMIF